MMNTTPSTKEIKNKCAVSTCGLCRHYQPEGRRGGQCQQFGVQVQFKWSACPLSVAPFLPTLKTPTPATIGASVYTSLSLQNVPSPA